MKLYSRDLSPFAARVRAAIYAKGLDIEILPPPPGGTRSPEYLALNPMGQVPLLVFSDGSALPESETILEYLEDAFPQTPLQPATPEGRARARLIVRIADLYVMTNLGRLYGQMEPKTRDQAVVDAAAVKIREGLAHLDAFLGDGPYAMGETFTTADCGLIPVLFFVNMMSVAFGLKDMFADAPKVAAYAKSIQSDAIAQKLTAELRAGLAQMQATTRAQLARG